MKEIIGAPELQELKRSALEGRLSDRVDSNIASVIRTRHKWPSEHIPFGCLVCARVTRVHFATTVVHAGRTSKLTG